jgi:hypothetical protein
LTHKDKFILDEERTAIYNRDSIGPAFGGGKDFVIHDKADKKEDSYANICSSYVNRNYSYNEL